MALNGLYCAENNSCMTYLVLRFYCAGDISSLIEFSNNHVRYFDVVADFHFFVGVFVPHFAQEVLFVLRDDDILTYPCLPFM